MNKQEINAWLIEASESVYTAQELVTDVVEDLHYVDQLERALDYLEKADQLIRDSVIRGR